MMNLEAIETEIVTLIEQGLPSFGFALGTVEVLALPEVEAEFANIDEKPQVTVAISGVEGMENKVIGTVVQHPVAKVEVILKARRIRGGSGIYALSEAVRKCVVGKRTPSSSFFATFHQFQLNSINDGTWNYSLFFNIPCMIVEEVEDESLTAPLLQEVDFNENT